LLLLLLLLLLLATDKSLVQKIILNVAYGVGTVGAKVETFIKQVTRNCQLCKIKLFLFITYCELLACHKMRVLQMWMSK
jgi:hypothetical protein